MRDLTAAPEKIRLNKSKNRLLLEFAHDNVQRFELSAEYLRVHSPSAEVRGHRQEEKKLVTGKKQVRIVSLKQCGNYALKITFDDGHDSGLYTWQYLYELCLNKEHYQRIYLNQLHCASASRDPAESIIKLVSPCSS